MIWVNDYITFNDWMITCRWMTEWHCHYMWSMNETPHVIQWLNDYMSLNECAWNMQWMKSEGEKEWKSEGEKEWKSEGVKEWKSEGVKAEYRLFYRALLQKRPAGFTCWDDILQWRHVIQTCRLYLLPSTRAVPTISRLLKIVGLFSRISSLL